MRRITAVAILTLTCILGGSPSVNTVRADSCESSDVRTGIVGSWRGSAHFIHDGRLFYPVDAWFRFTNYGLVELSRGPLSHGDPSFAAGLRLVGDYIVVGTNVVIMLHANSTTFPYTLTGVKASCGQLEFISTTGLVRDSNGQVSFSLGQSTGFMLRRD